MIREDRRRDGITAAIDEVLFWTRQARKRTTLHGRRHAEAKRQEWSLRLTELQAGEPLPSGHQGN